MGFCGNGQGIDDLLGGHYQKQSLSMHVQLLIQHLKISREMAQLRSFPTITQEEFEGKLNAWRESTTTSPSGMHLGHYKSLLARHKYSNAVPDTDSQSATENKDMHSDYDNKHEYDRMQQASLQVHLHLLN